MKPTIKFIVEVTPIIVFFVLYKFYGMVQATSGLIIATIIFLIVSYIMEKKVSTIAVFSCIILTVMGCITLYTGDSKFIKLKPTVLNIAFALILFGGIFLKKGLIKYIFGQVMQLPEQAWITLSYRWAIFFLILALCNELVWRNFSDNTWIKFKVFGILPIMMLFMLTQVPFLNKHKITTEE